MDPLSFSSRRRVALKPMYYWIVGINSETGKLAIVGPKESKDEAEALATGRGFLDYEVTSLPTRNDARATRLVKGIRFENSTIMETVQRMSHPKGEEVE